jgi:hypothetical protein
MTKIKILLILITIVFKINNASAQAGIDLSFSPFNSYTDFKDEIVNSLEKESNLSFRIGYFEWTTVNAMNKYSLQINSTNNTIYTLTSSDIWGKEVKTNYSYEAQSYIFRFEGIGVFNEIDCKSHFFFKSAYLFGLKNTKLSATNTEIINTGSQNTDSKEISNSNFDKLGGSDVLFGFELGLGYQYNITKLMGIYLDAGVGYILPSVYFYDTNIGIRYRFK